LLNKKDEIRKMIIFDGEGMIVCMNNLSNASKEEMNLWRNFYDEC
jgi:hypothetical protein